jgi:2,4-dienoyl-CoA reductase-like NADH-dependent reductase (Old Yellow Enzyme family)
VGSIGLSGSDFINSFRGQGAEVGGLEELTRRLERGDFDLVGVGRALLTDPHWVKKVKEARTGELKGFNPADLAVLT